ncbi:MAG TPA: GNAT family N-acetyltransferase [Burkholderiales bacterium]|nr:GNAT family N-acetyltransferase [Burkholderiales bacterium]
MFRIAPIAEGHIEGFREVLDSVARERRALLFLEAPPPKDVGEFVRRSIARQYPHYVALVEGRVVGWCDVLPADWRATRAHAGLLGIGVLAEFRGQGIGRALIGRTLESARAFGFTRIELSYRQGNARVASLYESFGFVREGVQRSAVRVDGVYEDLVLMALLLG